MKKTFKFLAVIVAIAALSYGLISEPPTYYSLAMFTTTKGFKPEITYYLTSGDENKSIPSEVGEPEVAVVNRLVKEGYVVDQWIFNSQVSGTNYVTIVCILKK